LPYSPTKERHDFIESLFHVELALNFRVDYPNLVEPRWLKQPGQQEGAAMAENTPSPLGNIISIDDEQIKVRPR
jgi:hypothetical protein